MTARLDLTEWSGPMVAPDGRLDDADRDLALELRKTGRLKVIDTRAGLEVSATSWVGRVVLGGVTITVRPKIAGAPLVQLLRYAYGLDHLAAHGRGDFDAERDAFQDLLGHQLAQEAARLMARGLHRDYDPHEAAIATPRGRILFGRMAETLARGRAELPVRSVERRLDNPLNLAVASGLRKAAGLMTDPRLAGDLRRQAGTMDMDAPPFRPEHLTRAWRRIDRRTRRYEPALTLIGLLTEGSGVSLDRAGQPLRLDGFLFDMNRFFQALVSRLLRDHLADNVVLDERRLQPMFRYTSRTPARREPVLRPDVTVLAADGETRAILDAKYRDLWANRLPSSMLYQLALYARAAPNQRAAIIYPSLEPRTAQHVVMSDPVTGKDCARIDLRALDLADLAARLSAPADASSRRRLDETAAALAFQPA